MRTRREFLEDCSCALTGFAVFPAGISRRKVAAGGVSGFAQISYLVLASQVNTLFWVRQSPGHTVELRLIEAPLAAAAPVASGVPLPGDARNERFSLIFSGPQEALLAPGIYSFEHTRLGQFDIYIGLIGRCTAGRVCYEAVFNRPPPGVAPGGSRLNQEI